MLIAASIGMLVEREKAELVKLAPPQQRKRIAAAKTRSEAKRSKQPEKQDAEEKV